MAKKDYTKKSASKKAAKNAMDKKNEKIEETTVIEQIQTNNEAETENVEPSHESFNEAETENVEPSHESFNEEVEETNTVENELNDDSALQEEVMRQVASEILEEKNNSINELLSMNKDEMIEKTREKIEGIKKANNERVNQKIDNIFGYLWNGQEMDY